MSEYIRNTPTADVLMTSMRSMGYTFEAAIADIIDNSISAHCSRVDVKFPIDPADCYVAICDDGHGMSQDELFDAMKYGSQIKKLGRNEDDLGRFGLGLKAASLSQCRKLTVISKKEENYAAYSWELDRVEDSCEWDLLQYSSAEISELRFFSYLDDKESGTVVIWEVFDFLKKNAGSVYSELSKFQESTTKYLSLIFHRFLNKESEERVEMWVNHFRLQGIDPFLEKHKKTNIRRKITLHIQDSNGIERAIMVQPYILPFQKDMTEEDKKLVGGIEDYRTKQGFYIYRNERLIIWGTWFGRARGELTKHARIKVDIPNSLDDIWGIDIKKQAATIPLIIRNQLTKAVDEAMDIAVKAQTYRGRVQKIDENVDYIWDRVKGRGDSFTYKINRESEIFSIIRNKVDDEIWSRIDMILEEIEQAVPYQQIYIDKSQNKIESDTDEERLQDIESKARMLMNMSIAMGNCERKAVLDRIFSAEPFVHYPAILKKLQEEG